MLETKTSVLKLIIEDDEGRKTVVPFLRDEITIGRQEGNTIRLTERNVSRRHARLMRQNGHVLIEDLGSYNGIRVNGDRIKGQVAIKDGDLVQIGDYDLALEQELADAMSNSTTIPLSTNPQRSSGPHRSLRPDNAATMPMMLPPEPPSTMTPPPLLEAKVQSTAVIRHDQVQSTQRVVADISPAEAPRLVVLNTEFAGREFPCTRTELKIGRTDDNDIALDHRSLSRTHVKVVREDNGEWRVIDMQSANGLLVNGEPYAQVTLRSGDVIELGHVKIRFVGAGEALTAPNAAETTEMPAARVSRTGPVLGGLVALVVIVVGIGGYAIYKRLYLATPTPSANPTPTVNPDVAANRAASERVAEAEKAIAELDWAKAESLLRQSVDHSQRAQQLLDVMESERPYRQALVLAQDALAKGNLAEATRQLESASESILLLPQWQQLDQQRAELAKKALASKPQVSPEAAPHLEAGRKLMEERQFRQAIAPLSKCVKSDPQAFECFALLGSAYSRENDTDRGLEWYRRFLREAPHDHPRYAGVAKRIADYEEQMRERNRER